MALTQDELQNNFTGVKDKIMENLNVIGSHDPDLSPRGKAAFDEIVAMLHELGEVVRGQKKGVVEPIPQSEVDKEDAKRKENKDWDAKKK